MHFYRGKEFFLKNFALIGGAGYIAPRHFKAIKETGNRLVAVSDPHDSMGILDSFFDDVDYFREFERFDRHIEKLRRQGEEKRVHYVSICSPNYLHDAHIRFALRVKADAICEKPLVLNPWNLDALLDLEQETGKKVYAILQLRLHPSLQALKQRLEQGKASSLKEIVLTYITSRGNWYLYSWKGDKNKSGGLSTNIGVHFFDALLWLFGGVCHSELHLREPRKEAGFLELEKGRVRWFLSIDKNDLPPDARTRTYRSISVDGEEIEFSEGFADLHTLNYQEILGGNGFGIEDARASIETVYHIRNAEPVKPKGTGHNFL